LDVGIADGNSQHTTATEGKTSRNSEPTTELPADELALVLQF
jgi:hypothetical protein